MYFAKFVAAAIVASSALIASAEPAPAPVIRQAPAGAPQLPTLTPQQLAAPPPNRIVRTPLVFQARTLTNRVVLKPNLVNLINKGLTVPLKQPSPPPGKRALVVILENGGIMNNVDPALRQALNVNIKSVTCGNFEFELRPGENLLDLIARVANQLASNLACLDPKNWREQVFNPLQWLNQITDNALENAVKAQNSLLNTQSHYDQVVVMEDADAVPDRVIAAMRSLAPTHVLDVHVLTHGGQEFFVGQNASFTAANFFQPLKADTDAKRMYVRAVYQMNCFSSTLKDDWIALGAISVNGTQNPTLNNMPQQYFHWLQRWLAQAQGMGTASDGSFNDAAAYSRPIYSIVGKGALVDVSHLTATGRTANANVNAGM